jgi:hypothetical protein
MRTTGLIYLGLVCRRGQQTGGWSSSKRVPQVDVVVFSAVTIVFAASVTVSMVVYYRLSILNVIRWYYAGLLIFYYCFGNIHNWERLMMDMEGCLFHWRRSVYIYFTVPISKLIIGWPTVVCLLAIRFFLLIGCYYLYRDGLGIYDRGWSHLSVYTPFLSIVSLCDIKLSIISVYQPIFFVFVSYYYVCWYIISCRR